MHRLNKFGLTFVLAASIAGSPATGIAAAGSPAASAASPISSRISIDNFARVNDAYFRGAQPIGDDYVDLAAMGVKTVIDLQEYGQPTEKAEVEKAGMKYVQFKMTTRVVPTEEQLASFLAIVNDPASQPVYVHCAGGRHRTGVMTAVYRMNHDGINGEKAFKEMKQYKYGADFLHPEFKRFVYDYKVASKLAAVPAAPVAPTEQVAGVSASN